MHWNLFQLKTSSLEMSRIHDYLINSSITHTVEPRFRERQPSGNPRISGNFADDQIFIL